MTLYVTLHKNGGVRLAFRPAVCQATSVEPRFNLQLTSLAQSILDIMAEFFATHSKLSQASCDTYAEQVVGQLVRPLGWQGCFSYTLESEDERTVVQFRSMHC